MNYKTPLLAAALAVAMASPAPAELLVQELFDAIAGPPPGTDQPLYGLGDTSTTIGLTDYWISNAGNIYVASNFNAGDGLPGLPPSGGEQGGVWSHSDSWNTDIYSTRQLTTAIDFSTNQVIYFSVHLRNSGDMAAGIGLASGLDPSSEFVGAGLTWNNATSIGGEANNAGNSAYIGYGTLDTESGAYGIRTFQGKDTTDGAALIVGRITINSTGPDTIDIVRYLEDGVIADDLSTLEWSATASFDTDMLATDLLLFTNGNNGAGEVDAIRFGTTWFDVTGVEAVPEPASLSLVAAAGLGAALFLRRRRG